MCDSKKMVTDNERNAIFTILTPEECLLFGQSLNALSKEYKESDGALTVNSFIPVLCKLPNIPDTHEMDAKLEAMDARNIYIEKMNSIFNLLKYEFQRGHI